jgi:hypothetical protein
MIVSHTLKLLIILGLNFVILMRALLKLSLLVRTLTIGVSNLLSQTRRVTR